MKKTIIAVAVAAAALATTAFAGGYAPAPHKGFKNRTYVTMNLGAANRHNQYANHASTAGEENTNWGWAFGLGAGYKFNRVMGAELGAFYVTRQKFSDHTYSNWVFYLDGTMTHRIADQLSLFAKAGLTLNHVTGTGAGTTTAVLGNGFGPNFAVGSTYHYNHRTDLVAQYMYVTPSWNRAAGAGDRNPKTSQMQVVTLGLNYKLTA